MPTWLSKGDDYYMQVWYPRSYNPLDYWIGETVTIRVTAQWMREPAAASDWWACVEGEQRRLMEALTIDRIDAIANRVKRSSRDLALKKVVHSALPYLNNVWVSASRDQLRNIFDWNEVVIEYLPWWLTELGAGNYEQLRAGLYNLPIDLDVNAYLEDYLISSRARIYLPISPGYEQMAIALMTGPVSQPFQTLIAEFNQFRQSRYGRIDHPLPDFESVSSPLNTIATGHNAADWDNSFEKPQRKFEVLAQWAELFPTDGVHGEISFSSGTGTDEVRTEQVRRGLL
jgi:hypothetical protein